MKNLIGLPARGGDFFQRKREIEKITSCLSGGNNIQITAPRRVGKTSILWYLLDNRIAGRHYVYVDTESVAEEPHFYRKVLEAVINDPQISRSVKLKTGFREKANRFFQRIKSISVLETSLEFNQETTIRDYYDEFHAFLSGYAITEEIELVLLIDEFPQTIENMRKVSSERAVNFLQKKRALRIDPVISQKIRFIYTGSIGLNQTVAAIDATAMINDLASIEVAPLSETEAIELFRTLLHAHQRSINSSAEAAFKTVLQWYIPFHIQLLVQEIIQCTSDHAEITDITIEKALTELLTLRHKNHFQHYHSRLKTHFKDQAFKYADELLKKLAATNSLNKQDAFEMAVRHQQEEHYKMIIEDLMHDGYIHFNTTTRVYLFNSPILKRWWELFIC
ncbi:hypothetical protein [Chitinophaga nivalis]|uniref:ATPase domain-containing protein n=1 Tax=Chitinophaga nivalis TaxID=2991709 RepID=A0ABT3ISJ4_9BACT|nr:hypothetical protein [Chitinophaga nivalis]MCW3463405.1 hypothetical protein [Chitinophaga nivalis]MCW3486905.1 hypothetical protein [Chitinophaga nivalis]